MATFFSGVDVGYWNATSNIMRGTLTGDVTRSGDTVTLSNLSLAITPTVSSYGTSSFAFTIEGSTTSQTISAPPTTISLNNASKNVGASDTSTSFSWSSSDGRSGSFNVSFPARQSAPTGLAASDIQRFTNGFSATVSVTGWGGAGDASTRYRELQVWTYDASSLTPPRAYVPIRGNTTSSTIVVDNDVEHSGELVIQPNTKYTLGMHASNGTYNTGSQRIGDYTTLAEAPTVTFESTDGTSATFSYATTADGGEYDKTIEYSLDGGTTWTTAAIITTGAATTGSFTITGLSQGQDYVLQVRTTTAAGSTVGESVAFSTGATSGLASVGGIATKITGILGSVDGVATKITKALGSVDGTATAL